MTDPSGDEPDLLAQATAAQPLTHERRRSSRRRRRRRHGPSPTLIGVIVFVVLVVVAGGAILYAHRSSKSSVNSPGDLVSVSWTYHDLSGHGVTVLPTSTTKFVAVTGGEVPEAVRAIDLMTTQHNCAVLEYDYKLAYTLARTTSGPKAQPAANRKIGSTFAAYARDNARRIACGWVQATG